MIQNNNIKDITEKIKNKKNKKNIRNQHRFNNQDSKKLDDFLEKLYNSNFEDHKFLLDEYSKISNITISQIQYLDNKSKTDSKCIRFKNELEKKLNQVNFVMNNYHYKRVDEFISNSNNEITNIKTKINSIEDSFSNIGLTLIGLAISFTFIPTAITAINEMTKEYIPLFIVFIVWLGMTLIGYASSIFTKSYNKITYIYYGIITFLFVFLIFKAIA